MKLIRINNRKNTLLTEVPNYHPQTSKYLKFWQEQFKRIIEGFWFPDDASINWDVEFPDQSIIKTNKWRFIPPALYFYCNFGTILHKKAGSAKTAPKIAMRPNLRDIDWEIYYDVLEARGFSGFKGDAKYTCNRDILDIDFSIEEFKKTCYNEKGIFLEEIWYDIMQIDDIHIKEYIPANKYLRQLYKSPKGIPLYYNGASNYMVLSSRSIGKSYSAAGVSIHELITDGIKKYTADQEIPVSEQFVGSGIAAKSTDLMKKIERMMFHLPGAWKRNTPDYIASPLYKEMSGSINPNNKWRHHYKRRVGSDWVWVGSASNITHGVFTTQNPEAAAGGRYTYIFCEEVGLTPHILSVHYSNEAAQVDSSWAMGTSFYLGTSGDIEKVMESEMIFNHPSNFNMLAFDDEWEDTGKICRFFPAELSLEDKRDENGNIDWEAAVKHFDKKREAASKMRDPGALYGEKMNFPRKPSEMFLSKDGAFFPVDDLKFHYGKVVSDKILRSAVRKVKLILNEGTVTWEYSNKLIITDYPYINSRGTDTAIEIYDLPVINPETSKPWDGRYILATDPVDDDDVEKDSSLQSTLVLDLWLDVIVAEYTGRPLIASEYYENVRRLGMLYNGLNCYENNKKGLYNHFNTANSTYLLATTPELLKDQQIIKRASKIGNKAYGINNTEAVKDLGMKLAYGWLVKKFKLDEDIDILNLERIRGLGLLQELIKYNKKKNCDRVSALGILMIYREDRLRYINTDKEKQVVKVSGDKFFDKSFQKRQNVYRKPHKRSFSFGNM